MANVIDVVSQIRNLARDETKRAAIVRDDGCLPGLALFLDNENAEVVDIALEALSLLSSCEENREAMRLELPITIGLKDILAQDKFSAAQKESAQAVIDRLQEPTSPSITERRPLSAMNTPNHSIFRGNLNKTARTITLQVEGLDDLASKDTVEEILLGVKGVVSFTFSLKESRVIVRARNEVMVEQLCGAICSTEKAALSAKQVVKNESGQEIILSFGNTPSSVKENASIPQYLDDDDDYPDESAFQKAVARVGEQANSAGGWLGSALGYVKSNLYW